MCGLKQSKGIIHAQNFGRKDMQRLMIGKNGGKFRQMAKNPDIYTF